MTGLINIGFGNLVNADRVIAIVAPDSAPAKRLSQRARQEWTLRREGRQGVLSLWIRAVLYYLR